MGSVNTIHLLRLSYTENNEWFQRRYHTKGPRPTIDSRVTLQFYFTAHWHAHQDYGCVQCGHDLCSQHIKGGLILNFE